MLYIIGFIFAIYVVFSIVKSLIKAAKNRIEDSERTELAQRVLDVYCKAEKAFIMNYMPFINYLQCLDYYYKNGGKKLSEIELNYFLSFPKHLYIDNKDDVICNGVNIGSMKAEPIDGYGVKKGCYDLCKIECQLFRDREETEPASIIDDFGRTTPTRKKHETNLVSINDFKSDKYFSYFYFRNMCDGNMIINEYKFAKSFSCFFFDNLINKANEYTRSLMFGIEDCISEFEIYYDRYKELVDKYLPKELKEMYLDFNKNNYKKDEMDKKLVEYYIKSQEIYKNHLKEKNELYKLEASSDRTAKYYTKDGKYVSKEAEKLVHDVLFGKNKTFLGSKTARIVNEYECKGLFFDEIKDSIEYEIYKFHHRSGYCPDIKIKEFELSGYEKKIMEKYNLKVNY